MKRQRTEKFFIVVNPVASKFAKALQGALSGLIRHKVLRTNKDRQGRVALKGRSFVVTPRSLNKIEQFERFQNQNISAPRYFCSKEAVRRSDVRDVFARTLVNSTNGRGIVEFKQSDEDYPQAPLYTEYIPKKAEYRFHIFNGEVIDVQQKKKKHGFNEDERNTRIRNLNNGYVYCRDGVCPPDGAADLAIRAVAACGYKYGAVDLIYNEKRNCSYVLEVNSRPGLQGQTLLAYANAIIKEFNLAI